MAASRPKVGGTPASAGGLLLGRWEWVALPEFGISCMRARLGPEADASLLAIEGVTRVDSEGHPGLRFRIYPLAGDDRTFVLAEALAVLPRIWPEPLGPDGDER